MVYNGGVLWCCGVLCCGVVECCGCAGLRLRWSWRRRPTRRQHGASPSSTPPPVSVWFLWRAAESPQPQHHRSNNTSQQPTPTRRSAHLPYSCSVSKWSLDKATCSMCNLRFFNQRRLVLDMHYLTLSSMQYWSKSISAEYRQNTRIIVYPRRNAQKLEKFKCMENEKETNLFMKGVYFLTRL